MTYYRTDTPLPPYLPYPRFLLELPLTETARLVYTLLLSRTTLSQRSGWTNENGWVWCRYTIQELAKDTGKGKTSIVSALADLQEQGLLFRSRSGAGYANRLYLRLPENCTSDCRKTAPQTAGNPAPSKYKNNKKKLLNYEYQGGSL